MKCKYCESENLVLDQRSTETKDILNANSVAVKCDDCGKFQKWCPKTEREYYYLNTIKNHPELTRPTIEEQPKLQVKPQKDTISKQDVLDIIDKIIAQSARILAYPTIRSIEARAMLNGVKDEVQKL